MNLKDYYLKHKKILLIIGASAILIIFLLGGIQWYKNKDTNIHKDLIETSHKNNLDPDNFFYSVPNEIGQLFPSLDFGMWSIYPDSQEFLTQHCLISPFFKELVDETKLNEYNEEEKKIIIHKDAHKLPRKFDFHLIKNIQVEGNDDFNQYIGNHNGYKNSSNKKSKDFTFELRQDAKFENNTPIDVETIKYAFDFYSSQFSDFKEKIGFLDISIIPNENYKFKISFLEEKSLFDVIKKLNLICLLEKTCLENSLIKDQTEIQEIKYGTKEHPFISYGSHKVTQGYNDSKWIFEKNPAYFDQNKYKSYKKIELLIEQNNGNSHKEKELFEQGKISFVAIEHNHEMNNDFYNKFKNDLFCKPETYSLALELKGQRVDNINLKKALFYGINRKLLTDDIFLHPTLDYMSDLYCDKKTSIKTYNETEIHEKNINQTLKNDLLLLNLNTNIEEEISKLKNNLGYDIELAKRFFKKYIDETSSQGDINLILATRDGNFTNEKFIGNFKKQIEENLSLDGHKIKIQYRLNESDADINISVTGLKPEMFISQQEQNTRQPNPGTTFRLNEEENKNIPNLESKVYEKLFIIPLYQQKQIRFLKNATTDFNKYYGIFGFKSQPYDFLDEAF